MKEIEKNMMVKDHKIMLAYNSYTMRGIVDYANANEIQKDDIVSLLNKDGQYILVYYK